jgi:hypothetical protein
LRSKPPALRKRFELAVSTPPDRCKTGKLTKEEAMKIRMTFTVDVDEQAWMAEYQGARVEVPAAVRSYFEQLLRESHPVAREIVTVDIKH